MESLYFPKGVYKVVCQGLKFHIFSRGQGDWTCECPELDVSTWAPTKGQATRRMASTVGVAYGRGSNRTLKPKEPKGPAKPCIVQADKGLYVYGFSEVCEILADSRVDTGLPGKVDTAHRTRRGKTCTFISKQAVGDFWYLLQEECQGQEYVVGASGNYWDKTV